MKLSIEKVPSGKLKISLATATDKKPINFTVAPEQIASLLSLLQTASSSSTFSFSIEL